jgi:hypothetical protein
LVATASGILALSTAYVGQWLAAGVSAATCLAATLTFRTLLNRFLAPWQRFDDESNAAANGHH